MSRHRAVEIQNCDAASDTLTLTENNSTLSTQQQHMKRDIICDTVSTSMSKEQLESLFWRD